MHVIATAGHVDHGKSALVKALTGSEPDRLGEERRRGLSIELGYAWTSIEGIGDVAFVDVPGHERFITTMLAGVGPVPAVLFVVAADDPWMPQAAEHLAALDALGVRHGVVAVTRSDLADPRPAAARAAQEVQPTSLAGAPVVPVSNRTGAGLDRLRTQLIAMIQALPDPDVDTDVRLWVDRRFTISGAGTVITATLPSGTVARGDVLSTGSGKVRVRGVETLGEPVQAVSGVARVALNLAGDLDDLDRGSTLSTPEAFRWTEVIDVRVSGDVTRLPTLPMLHVGASSLNVRCRPLADNLLRLTLQRPLPLRVGDRVLLRDPGTRLVWGTRVLDPLPPPLRRRGAAVGRARILNTPSAEPDLVCEVERREVVDRGTLRRITGLPDSTLAEADPVVRVGRWLMSADRAERARAQILQAVTAHDRARPFDRGLPLAVLSERIGLPSPGLVEAVLREPLHLVGGMVLASNDDVIPAEVEQALAALTGDLTERPFAAPAADRLRELGLDVARVAVAAKAGRLLRLAPGVVLLPDAAGQAVDVLGELPQPFTVGQARTRLGSSRRVVLPLLQHLDRAGLTRRLPDDRRVVIDSG